MSGVLRPFHNETHAANSVYFETVFAYFAAVIKRTLRMLRKRRLNPVGQESLLQLQRQPAKTLSVAVNPLTGRSAPFPAAHTTVARCPVPQLVRGLGGSGERRRRHGMAATEGWRAENSNSYITWGPAGNSSPRESDTHRLKPQLHLLTAVLPRVDYLTSLCLASPICKMMSITAPTS